ncbi:MAG TPA: DUF5683 domain-containing protein, partial [Ferruginibacter sp.]|nr:DUF5683 domain-containing protein [Ferruginibacter sp.]
MCKAFRIFFIAALLFASNGLLAQKTDTTATGKNRPLKNKRYNLFSRTDTTMPYSPKRAMYRSAILPGWGQATNKKYWKIPVVYA